MDHSPPFMSIVPDVHTSIPPVAFEVDREGLVVERVIAIEINLTDRLWIQTAEPDPTLPLTDQVWLETLETILTLNREIRNLDPKALCHSMHKEGVFTLRYTQSDCSAPSF